MVKKQTKHKKCNICIALGKIEGKKELVNQQIKQASYYCCKNNKCSCYHTGKQAGSKEEQERIIEIIMKWWNTEKDVPSLIKEIQCQQNVKHSDKVNKTEKKTTTPIVESGLKTETSLLGKSTQSFSTTADTKSPNKSEYVTANSLLIQNRFQTGSDISTKLDNSKLPNTLAKSSGDYNLKSPRVEKSVEIQNYEPTNGVASANRMHTTVERSSTHSDSLFKTKSPYRVGN